MTPATGQWTGSELAQRSHLPLLVGGGWAVEAKRQVGVELPEVAAFVTAERHCRGGGAGDCRWRRAGGVGCVPLR